MRILGIDYGQSKVGLAIAEGKLAEPLGVIRYKDIRTLSEKLEKIRKENRIDKVVVGVSSGTMAKEQKEFACKIGAETFDETLTTREAQRLSLEAGLPRKKRRKMEDAFAASLMLQSYIDQHV